MKNLTARTRFILPWPLEMIMRVTHLHVANEHDDHQKEVTKEHKILQRDKISDGKASPFVQVRY